MQTFTTDVLIIGSGAAGLSAAAYASKSNKQVLVLDKGVIGRSGSSTGAVQIAGLGKWSHPDDNIESYLEDINKSGRGLSDPELSKTLAENISSRLTDLIDWGLKLDVDVEKNVAVSHTSGHSLPRSLSAKKGKTGLGITHTLRKKVNASSNIESWSDVITIKLVKSLERVTGAVVFDLKTNHLYLIQSKAVILATGGSGQLYPITSNPVQSTSDGFSLGLSAGASLIDMEQVQFYPVSMMYPRSIAGFCISFYHFSKLYNNLGKRFMRNYQPATLEDSTRDKLAIAIATEIAEGRGTSNGGVWLDVAEEIEQVKHEFPHEYKLCRDRGIDLTSHRAEVGPAAHFMMGGIQSNQDAATSIPGLYVAGETAGGLHGGNRLGNNALSECIVFGARAGIAAANDAAQLLSIPQTNSLEWKNIEDTMKQLFSATGTIRPYQIKTRIQSIMGEHVGVIRTKSGLEKAWQNLAIVNDQLSDVKITNKDVYSREILDFIEASHMVRTAQAVVGAALTRSESRGAHFNLDFPNQSSLIKHTLVSAENDKLTMRTTPIQGGA